MESGKLIILIGSFLFGGCDSPSSAIETDYDIVINGAGTGATTASISSDRQGVKTLINPISWLGGMLSSAGVSTIDGNHEMPAGLYGEFRSVLGQHYGGGKDIGDGLD